MQNFIVNFSFQLPSFQEKLMSSCASNLVFTTGLIFIFTILFIYITLSYFTWKKKHFLKCRSISNEAMCATGLQNILIFKFEKYTWIDTRI
jgi:hypothetical protein